MANLSIPAAFASGACMAFGPTAGGRHQTVFLDASHGGLDPGAVGTTRTGTTIDEADETLPVELDTMALLRAKGFRVVVSRTRSSTVLRLGPGDVFSGALTFQGAHDDVAARDVCANLAKADAVGAENVIRRAHAASSCSWMRPPIRSDLRR